ncbi:MAG: hypothetical protein O3A19_09285 [Planctomycetota bacterium]|nr:hypothetical protein [Planctomycetota bacterium]MDA1026607.1 hypothetical protein [Planctomycetota bacterium]
MPASRSRTHDWRRLLEQIHERGGAIEFAIAHPDRGETDPSLHVNGPDLVWRVRVLDLTSEEIAVERPVTLGREVRIDEGTELVGAIAIGQNRWTFRTTNLGDVSGGNLGHPLGLRLAMPTEVSRSQRRRIRVDTKAVTLPNVEIWPLLDPKSVIPAERATELAFEAWKSGEKVTGADLFSDAVMPVIGPKFTAELANLGGGGVGLVVNHDNAAAVGRHRIFWLRLSLEPEIPIPVCASGKVVHTHIDSMQKTYVGIAFDFSFNLPHQTMVANQILGYIEKQQELQRQARDQRESGRPG